MNKTLKAALFIAALLICLVIAVMGWHWADTATTPFWWNFWPGAAVTAVLLFFIVTRWFNKSRKKW